MSPADRASRRAACQAPGAADQRGARPITSLLVVGAIVAASFVKGSIAFGFPLVATPLLALATDVKTGIALSILPNVVMDGIQIVRRGGIFATVRRLAVVVGFSAIGTVFGTKLLVLLPERVASATLGAFILVFVAFAAADAVPRLPASWERPLAPVVGLAAGVLTGLTNAASTPLVIYFHALGMSKQEFVRSIALVFITVKVAQLGATGWYGLLTWPLLLGSAGLTVIALVAFAAGLRFQDRLPEKVFRRVVLGFLAVTGAWLAVRGLAG